MMNNDWPCNTHATHSKESSSCETSTTSAEQGSALSSRPRRSAITSKTLNRRYNTGQASAIAPEGIRQRVACRRGRKCRRDARCRHRGPRRDCARPASAPPPRAVAKQQQEENENRVGVAGGGDLRTDCARARAMLNRLDRSAGLIHSNRLKNSSRLSQDCATNRREARLACAMRAD